jgi:hypothetical protein
MSEAFAVPCWSWSCVPVKRVVDYNVKIRSRKTGQGVEPRQCEDVDEPVRRNRRRRGDALKEAGKAERNRRRFHRTRKAQETLRTALAMGADRGILVKTDDTTEPLAVAKILKASSPEGTARTSSSWASRRSTMTATRPARCWPRCLAGPGTFRLQGRDLGDSIAVTREVDGGLQTVKLQAAGHRHHRSAPQRAALRLAAQHHEGQEEAARQEDTRRHGVDIAPR